MSIESDLKIEKRLQELQADAPRLHATYVHGLIVKETFTRLPSQKVLICELTLKNGFTVRGESSIVSPENFRQEIGEQVSRDRAIAQIWPLEGYLLQQALYDQALQEAGLSNGYKPGIGKVYTHDELNVWRDDAFRAAISLIQRIKLFPDNKDHDFVRGQLEIVHHALQGLLSKQYSEPWYLASVLTPTYIDRPIPVVFQVGEDGEEYLGFYGPYTDPQASLQPSVPAFYTDDGQQMDAMVWRFHTAQFREPDGRV